MPRKGDLAPSGAMLAGKTIELDLRGDLADTGCIAGRQLTQITAQNVQITEAREPAD